MSVGTDVKSPNIFQDRTITGIDEGMHPQQLRNGMLWQYHLIFDIVILLW